MIGYNTHKIADQLRVRTISVLISGQKKEKFSPKTILEFNFPFELMAKML
jgi:hypothetical protein